MTPGKLTVDQFEFLIDQFNLNPEYSIFINEDNDIIIDEEWSSRNKDGVTANRIYKFDIGSLEMIREDDRLRVLNQILDLYIQIENYEKCADVRDLINSI